MFGAQLLRINNTCAIKETGGQLKELHEMKSLMALLFFFFFALLLFNYGDAMTDSVRTDYSKTGKKKT